MNAAVHLDLWHVAAGNLWRRRGRTVATFVPLLTAMTMFAALSFVRDGMLQDALRSADAMPDLTVQTLIGGRPDRVPLSLRTRIAGIRDVARVAPRVWGYVPLQIGGGGFTYVLMGIDVPAMPHPEAMGLAIETGRFLVPGDTASAVVGKTVAEGLDVVVGEELVLTDDMGNTGRLRIVGTFTSDVQIHAADLIVTSIDDARRFFGYREDEGTDLCVYLGDPAAAPAVAGEILEATPGARVLGRDAVKDVVRQVFNRRAGVFQVLWLVLLLTALLVAWAEASGMALRLDREIGILKATGWSTVNVIEMKAFESAIVAVAATLGGMLLGLAYLFLGAPGIKSYFLGWAVIYPDMALPMQVSVPTVASIAALGIFPLLVATVIPAWAAGIVDPDTAMRG